MPKRTDLSTILVIGSGPIVIGQACEFDYSGTQACRVLREEGYRVVLANSNPATIMTDPDFADRTYIEPLTVEVLAAIIERERPDAVLPTLGGQTALNLAMALHERGLVGVPGTPELIGANAEAISTAEDREKFKAAMIEIGLGVPRSGVAHSMDEARTVLADIGLPVIIRPAYILGGRGTGIAATMEEFERVVANGLAASPINEVLIETSIVGWKEYELEVMRDRADNCVIICSIENVDAMGVHTGDSITVAPAMTLSDVEYQKMRNAAFACIRRVGVETGGSNVQFAVHPRTGEQVVIEMNPRVSRSSALASKATGFPIAKIAAKLAVGYTLDEIPNDITKMTPASFEPTIDYVVTKVPRWAFEKFAGSSDELGTQMRSVGEVMAIGRTFPESLQKALRSLERGRLGLNCDPAEESLRAMSDAELLAAIARPTPERIFQIGECLRRGIEISVVHERSHVDPWFCDQMLLIVEHRAELAQRRLSDLTKQDWLRTKRLGFSDAQLAHLWGIDEDDVRLAREAAGVFPTYKSVDTCSAEFSAQTPYFYSTWEDESEVRESDAQRVIILGSGPNRIGQGIEFDYCCVHASFALRAAGYETVMLNCNPETVSTDYDTSDRLYFEPLTLEDVLEIVAVEKPAGVIVQFGGQTPLKLARDLEANGVPIIGTTPDSIDVAEDRERFQKLLHKLKLKQPPNRTARSEAKALSAAAEIGYPLVVRPSYVLGGRAMEIVHEQSELERYMREAIKVSNDSPVLLDRFLNDATEVDVDAVSDGEEVIIGGVMEHIEQAGVHSGDSACSLPPFSLSADLQAELRRQTVAMAKALKVNGLMNVQFAIQHGPEGDVVYVLEVNPRASRTVPFVSKATGLPLAKIAARCMAGRSLAAQSVTREIVPPYFCVKEAVFPFIKFPGADTILGPEMKSTGEVMGVGDSFAEAFVKSQLGSGERLPKSGKVFISLREDDKPRVLDVARVLTGLGFTLFATHGTAKALEAAGLAVSRVNKVAEGRPHIVDMIKNGEIALIINTVEEKRSAIRDSYSIRRAALQQRVTLYTTIAGARAAANGLAQAGELQVYAVQALHRRIAA